MSYICELCGRKIENYGMSSHIIRTHEMSTQEYYDSFIEPNASHICVCGNPTKYKNLSFGYFTYCCQDCSRRDALIKTREKYGVTNISQVPEINAKMRKSIKHSWDLIPLEQRNYRIKVVDEKIKSYCQQNQLTPLKDIVTLYGTGFMQNDLNLVEIVKYKNRLLIKNADIPIIEHYATLKVRSKHETYMYNLVKLYYPDALQNTRKIIKNRELDIYIPSLQVAIEFNGIKWHSIEHFDTMKTLHLDKSLECREQGIRLIHIYQFEDFQQQMGLLINFLEGTDNYPKEDFNKNNLIDKIPQSEIIYKTDKYTIYGAGKLYDSEV